jgi:asparagine synthase (glutamine-hydrolysing)
MCGIAGLVWASSATLPKDPRVIAEGMGFTLRHRGPDSFGTWLDRDARVALSHRRLSIIDLSDTGAQPMTSACGRYVLSYNGEIYNYRALREFIDQQRAGWNWRGTSDTEVVLALLTLLGIKESLTRLDGMFAIAVWDKEKRTLLLARDRFGEKPVSYAVKNGIFAFGSEIQSVKHALDFGRDDISAAAVAALFAVQTVPAPLSIYSAAQKLPAASYIEISHRDIADNSLPEAKLYWDMSSVAARAHDAPFKGSFLDAVNECHALLGKSVRTRMIADVPVGSMLSSGTDSTCITALAQAASGAPVKTYTIRVGGEGFDEADAAEAIANKLGTDHTTIPVGTADCLEFARQIAAKYDEPFADHSQIVTYALAKAIRQDVTVALSGDGGDELFAGYTRHFTGPKLWRKLNHIPLSVRKMAIAGINSVGEARVAELLKRGLSLNGKAQTGEAISRIQKAFRSMGAQSEADFYGSLISQSVASELLMVDPFDPASVYRHAPRPLHDQHSLLMRGMLLSDASFYLPETIMTKVDRAAMAVSLETRAPFLNAELLEFAWSLPDSFLVRGGVGKVVTRELAAGFVGQDALTRPKQGFAVPLGQWLRGPLHDWANDLLESSSTKEDSFLNLPAIRKIWHRHLSGAEDCSGQIWPLLSYVNWKICWN